MRIVLSLLICIAAESPSYAQHIFTINADSVKITSKSDSAELILQNHTQGILGGGLYNTGNGRTIFSQALQKLNDSTYLVGPDSLKVTPPASASAFTLCGIDFLYGNGNTGIPSRWGDSTYTDTSLVGRHVQVYLEGGYGSSFLIDSVTWVLLGSNPYTPYFRFNSGLGQLTFCNFLNITGLANKAFVVSIFAGAQGYGAIVDPGGG